MKTLSQDDAGGLKIVNLANGTAASDAAAYGQIPALPVTVPNGGTGLASLTAYALLGGGTTTTGALQQVTGTGTAGQVLVSQGAAALPQWKAPAIGLDYALSLRYAMP